jgi:hypothetical protein
MPTTLLHTMYGTTTGLAYDRLVTNTGANISSAWHFSMGGQEYLALDLGVPEPSSALLASFALVSLAAARHRRS